MAAPLDYLDEIPKGLQSLFHNSNIPSFPLPENFKLIETFNNNPSIQPRLPRFSKMIELPPRLRYVNASYEDPYRLSVEELNESLQYYEEARQNYLEIEEERNLLMGNNKPTGNVTVANDDADPEAEMEKEVDPFVHFINTIITIIRRLLLKDSGGYDYNWRSLVRELDINEGFFLVNAHKLHRGGEIYQFLVTVGRTLAEYRILESYRVYGTEGLMKFRETNFKQYKDFFDEIDWFAIYETMDSEIIDWAKYMDSLEVYKQVLNRIREGHMSHEVLRSEYPPPTKPFTPFVDDVVKATVDSQFYRHYYLEEIIALAERGIYGGDEFMFRLADKDTDNLWTCLSRDLSMLKVIYSSSPNPGMYFTVKKRIEDFRRLFFELRPYAPTKNGDLGYIAKSSAFRRMSDVLDVLEIKDEARRTIELNKYLTIPDAAQEYDDIPVFSSDDESDYDTRMSVSSQNDSYGGSE